VNYRSEKNVVFVAANMKDVALHLENMVPIRKYDGRRSKNSTILNLVIFLYKKILGIEDVRPSIRNSFLELSSNYAQFSLKLQEIESVELEGQS
jgi:hypothetical protein